MLTVKLVKGHDMKIFEAKEVSVYRCGPQNKLREVSGIDEGDKSFSFYLRDSNQPVTADNDGFAREVFFWDVAFVENATGATTQTVRPY